MDNTLARIRLAYRPLLIVAALFLPLSGLFYYMMSGYSRDIAFVRMELRGTLHLRPLERLLDLLPAHKRATRPAVAGIGTKGPEASSLSASIDQTFDALAAAQTAVGKELQFTKEGLGSRQRDTILLARLRQRWEELKQAAQGGQTTNLGERHDALVTDIRTAITHAGDTSNLILDPVLDSYYLVDVILGTLPATQERAAHVTDFAMSGDKNDFARQTQFAIFASQMKEADIERVNASLQTALNENATLNGDNHTLRLALAGPTKRYQTTAEEFLSLLSRQATNSAEVASSEDFSRAGEAFRAASFDCGRNSGRFQEKQNRWKFDCGPWIVSDVECQPSADDLLCGYHGINSGNYLPDFCHPRKNTSRFCNNSCISIGRRFACRWNQFFATLYHLRIWKILHARSVRSEP